MTATKPLRIKVMAHRCALTAEAGGFLGNLLVKLSSGSGCMADALKVQCVQASEDAGKVLVHSRLLVVIRPAPKDDHGKPLNGLDDFGQVVHGSRLLRRCGGLAALGGAVQSAKLLPGRPAGLFGLAGGKLAYGAGCDTRASCNVSLTKA